VSPRGSRQPAYPGKVAVRKDDAADRQQSGIAQPRSSKSKEEK